MASAAPTAASPAPAAPGTSSAGGGWKMQFPGNLTWSNAALATKGMAPYGAVAMNDIDDVCRRLAQRQSEPDAWREEWTALGARLEQRGLEAQASGRIRSGGRLLLRAGMYYFTGERFVPPGDAKRRLGADALRCQQQGLLSLYPSIERVEVPYRHDVPELAAPLDTTLPALLMKAKSSDGRPAPTVVVFDGMDNCKEMSVLFCGLEFAERGWNTLAIDGPGQGESLRLRGLYARHDYESAGRAALDYLLTRPEVAPHAVVILGYSFGGYYAARIAAFEPRYAAGVAFAALHWDLAGFQREVLRKQQDNPHSTAQSTFHFPWIMGCLGDPEAAIRKAERFSLQDVAHRVRMPFLVAHGADDKVVPVAAAQALYDALGSTQRSLKVFATEEGGSFHVSVDDRQIGVDHVADWIGSTLAGRGIDGRVPASNADH